MHRRLNQALLFLLIASVCASRSARAEGSLERMRKLIATFKGVKTAPEGGKLAPADRAANAKTFAALDGFFDFPTFSSECLGSSADQLTAPQVKEFKERLTHILRRRGYPNGGSVFNDGVVQEGKPSDKAGRTSVPLKISFPKQDLSMDVEFVFQAGKVVDLVLDGDSLTKDYRNQVSRIIAKSGAVDLLKRLADKQQAADKDADK